MNRSAASLKIPAMIACACLWAGGALAQDYGHHGEPRGESRAPPGQESRRDYGERDFGQRAYPPEPRGRPYGMPPGPGGDMRPPPRPGYPGYYPPPARFAAPNSLGSQWREQQEEARRGVRQGQMAPLSRVIAGIQRFSPGRQLDAGIEYEGTRAVYRVRWMTTRGRRVDYIVDAATGAILSGR